MRDREGGNRHAMLPFHTARRVGETAVVGRWGVCLWVAEGYATGQWGWGKPAVVQIIFPSLLLLFSAA